DFIRIGLGLAGFLMWMLGGLSEGIKTKQKGQGKNAPVNQADAEHPLAFLKRPRSWGMILLLSAGAHAVISAYGRAPAAPIQRPEVRIAKAIPPVAFPPLKLQGITVNGSKSSALINGEVLYLGEGIGNVRLVAVEPEQVKVELDGQTNVLSFRR